MSTLSTGCLVSDLSVMDSLYYVTLLIRRQPASISGLSACKHHGCATILDYCIYLISHIKWVLGLT